MSLRSVTNQVSDTIQGQGERLWAAAAGIFAYAMIVGYADNYVRVIAQSIGLWQFHATRSLMILAMLGLWVGLRGIKLRARNPRAVWLRALVQAGGILAYFAGLGFLPVPQVAAGLFTAPIFVLLIERFFYGAPIRLLQVVAVVCGFGGIVLVLGPAGDLGVLSLVPVLGGALYGLSAVATRRWCAGEEALVLGGAFFTTIGAVAALVLGLTSLMPLGEDYILRGVAWPTGEALWWTFVQALGALVGVVLMLRAYQLAPAPKVAVFEYVGLLTAAFWGWALWGEWPSLLAWSGMGLIVLAGLLIFARGR